MYYDVKVAEREIRNSVNDKSTSTTAAVTKRNMKMNASDCDI